MSIYDLIDAHARATTTEQVLIRIRIAQMLGLAIIQ